MSIFAPLDCLVCVKDSKFNCSLASQLSQSVEASQGSLYIPLLEGFKHLSVNRAGSFLLVKGETERALLHHARFRPQVHVFIPGSLPDMD